MKKFKFSAFCLSMLFLLVLGGCSGNDDEVTPPGEGPGSEVTIEIESEKGDEGSAIYATSATISLNLKGVETYTYQVEEGSVSESDFPDGEICLPMLKRKMVTAYLQLRMVKILLTYMA